MTTVRDLGSGRFLVDLEFRGVDGLVAGYLLPQDGGWTLVETGPTTCRAALAAGIATAGISPAEVRRIFVTHIHLDHAGGIGAAAAEFPNAELLVHERGAPHLIDPSRLAASARRAWGIQADPLWGAIVPAPAARVVPLKGGERFPLLGGELVVLATPGHAQHHLSFWDTRCRAVICGDAAGVRLEGETAARPAVPPPDLDLDQLFASLSTMAAVDPKQLWYSHFGPSDDAVVDLAAYRRSVERWRDVALQAAREAATPEHVARALQVHDALERPASSAPGSALAERSALVSGYDLAAQGLLRYFQRTGLLPA